MNDWTAKAGVWSRDCLICDFTVLRVTRLSYSQTVRERLDDEGGRVEPWSHCILPLLLGAALRRHRRSAGHIQDSQITYKTVTVPHVHLRRPGVHVSPEYKTVKSHVRQSSHEASVFCLCYSELPLEDMEDLQVHLRDH